VCITASWFHQLYVNDQIAVLRAYEHGLNQVESHLINNPHSSQRHALRRRLRYRWNRIARLANAAGVRSAYELVKILKADNRSSIIRIGSERGAR